MSFEKKVLPNGMRILAIPMEGARTVTVLVLVEAGSKYESKEMNGISHFLEHMCFKGTTSRPNNRALSTLLDGLGAGSNAFTGEEYTGYYAQGTPCHLHQILDVISDLYLNPIFEPKEIEKEKGVIVDEINMYDDSPPEKVHEVWMNLLYGDQPAGWSITGPRDVVRRIKRNDFLAYRAAHYVAEATTVVVAGNIDSASVFEAVAEKFRRISARKKHVMPETLDVPDGPRVATLYQKTYQTNLCLGVRTFGFGDPRETIFDVLAGVLGEGMSSRLFHAIRDEGGMGYSVSASNNQYRGHGHFLVSTGIANDRAEDAVQVILAQMRDLKSTLVPEDELQKVKELLVGTLNLELESSVDFAFYYGMPEILHSGIHTPEEEEHLIRSVTAYDLRNMARKYFVEKNLNLALVGPFRKSEPFMKLLKL